VEVFFLILILVINVGISWWNSYVVGTTWKDMVAMGSWFERGVLWSALIQAGIGFSMPLILILGYGATFLLTVGTDPALTPEQASQFIEAVFSLWYVLIIFPLLGSGLLITAYSIREAYQRRDFTSIAVAGWNTVAQIHNTISAFQHLGGAFGNVAEFFREALSGDSDIRAKILIAAAAIVILSLVGGFTLAIMLVKHYARKVESRMEQYGREYLRA
jgi:hypothetical protein